jgi:hypothetical protein
LILSIAQYCDDDVHIAIANILAFASRKLGMVWSRDMHTGLDVENRESLQSSAVISAKLIFGY